MANYLIGIDSGTQSTKAIIVHASNGKVVGSASQAYSLIRGLSTGHKEQHPRVWINAVKSTIIGALRSSKINPREVVAIGVSGQQHGFVPLDKKGKVIRPAKLWCDTSTTDQCNQLISKLGGVKKVIGLTGNSVAAGFTGSKILWLKQKEPRNFSKLKTVLLPHDYINFWLTGRKVMEAGDASGTALFDVRRRAWRKEVIRAIDKNLHKKLPEVQGSHEAVGYVRSEISKQLGLPEKVLVSAGGGDNMMGAIGTGNTRPGVVTASFGTSGTIYAFSQKPIVDPKGEVAAFCDSTGGWLPLICTMNVTVATEAVRNCFKWSHEEFTKQVRSSETGSGGLLLIPYLEGERTPNVPQGTGVFFGIQSKTLNPAAFARSAMEGVTLGMNYGLGRLCSLGISPAEIRITGGGSKNPIWRQMMADIFNCDVIGMKTSEGAAYGGALQALWCWENSRGRRCKIRDITDEFVETDSKTAASPKKANVAIYKQLQELQNQAAADLSRMFQLHRKFTRRLNS
jgi:xylulokinase